MKPEVESFFSSFRLHPSSFIVPPSSVILSFHNPCIATVDELFQTAGTRLRDGRIYLTNHHLFIS
jgi:hypothetical protein